VATGSLDPVQSVGDALVDDELTIDELAARVGMTVRNIRAHQSRWLLPPPRIVGRTGRYGPAHVERLDRVRALQDEGLNLAAIARLLDDDPLTAVATRPFLDVAPEYRTVDDLRGAFGLTEDEPVVERAIAMGLIAVDEAAEDDPRVRVEVPRLVTVAEQLTAQGVPLEAMLDVVGVLQESSRAVAAAFMALADRHLVAGVLEATGGELGELQEAVERLQVQASAALEATFNRAMADEIRAYLAPPAD